MVVFLHKIGINISQVLSVANDNKHYIVFLGLLTSIRFRDGALYKVLVKILAWPITN